MNKIEMEKYAIWIFVVVIVYFIGFSSGRNDAKENFTQVVESAEIVECSNDGCYISIPNIDNIYASCGAGYSCERTAKTLDQRNKDEANLKLFKELSGSWPTTVIDPTE